MTHKIITGVDIIIYILKLQIKYLLFTIYRLKHN